MDFSQYDLNGLLALKNDVEQEIKRREHDAKEQARKQIVEIARNYGLTVEEILAKGTGARKPVEAKYRHPDHPELTWTGRGRQPVWFQELLASGKTKEDLAI